MAIRKRKGTTKTGMRSIINARTFNCFAGLVTCRQTSVLASVKENLMGDSFDWRPMKRMNRGTIIYLPSKSGRYFRYTVLSHHPEFSAATCVRSPKNGMACHQPVIMSLNGWISEMEIDGQRQFRKRQTLELKYADFIALVKRYGEDLRTLAPLTGKYWSYPGCWQKLQACRRAGLL